VTAPAVDALDVTVGRIARSIRLVGYALDVEGSDDAPALSDVTLEQYAIAAMLVFTPAIKDHVTAGVEPTDYVVPAHQLFYATILDLWGAGRAVDALTLDQRLRGTPTYEEIGGRAYLTALIEGCFDIAMAQSPAWAGLIHEMAMRRTLAGIGPRIRQAALEAPDLATAIGRAQEVLASSIQETGVPQASPHSRDILRDAAQAETFGTPWDALTFFTHGMARKQVWTLAGTSSHGKTTVALALVHHALCQDLRCAYFNLDSDSAAILHRLIALEGRCTKAAAALPVKPQSAEGERAWAARQKFTEGAWTDAYKTYAHIRDRSRILAEVRRHKMQYGLDMVVVDFIQNVTDGSADEYNRLGRLMTDMQQLSQVENVLVLLLSQTAMEQQKGMRATDALNAKGNAAVKDNSDVFLSLFRDRFATNEDDRHIMELTVQKVKEGATGPVFLWYDFLTGHIRPQPVDTQSVDYQMFVSQTGRGER
jgi:replicative DNA helicase